ncbi:hypothetical protein [Magnetospirillum aberrantis]|uniref:Uncharacterized protein n=1 Tax=Magnetospirillum aberrantis SpK TaxID=908842 RepID=A0A7C9QRK1_9PROT|nr:hypothetical protein [Magnetospirillum aberrantis]NFV78722.1 hypothetical protein [Magnetospirillum aberrantis SpK]
MSRRLFALAALSLVAATPAAADDGPLRLSCRADNPALLPAPLAFSIDMAAAKATETGSGEEYGVTAYRDGFGLWDPAGGPGTVVYRIDRIHGRFMRVDKQIRVDGTCEKVEPKL